MGNLRIMIVDDDRSWLDLLSTTLHERGFEVTVAGSAGEAVVRAREGEFHIIVCDLRMPILDGISCLDLIKSFSPATEFIMVSGQGCIQTAVDSIKKGAVDFLQKPVEIEKLLGLIHKISARIHLKTLSLNGVSASSVSTESGSLLPDLLQLFEAQGASFWKCDGGALMQIMAAGYPDDLPLQEIKELVAQVASAAKSLAPRNGALNHIQRDRSSNNLSDPMTTSIRSHLAVPLYFEEHFFGVLVISRLSVAVAFSSQDLRQAREIADRLAARTAYQGTRSELERKSEELRRLKEKKKAA